MIAESVDGDADAVLVAARSGAAQRRQVPIADSEFGSETFEPSARLFTQRARVLPHPSETQVD